ncbi:MAG: HPr family phosphocarrier protein [Notoacmeibacter sp.]|nr:HPr family phosphocarrier protein [Notoacmeibacter sp.]
MSGREQTAVPTITREIEIVNKRGLHARASARLVQLVTGYDAQVRVEKDGLAVDGGSILDLMMLAATPGCCITVTATGRQASEVIAAIEDLVSGKFGEDN